MPAAQSSTMSSTARRQGAGASDVLPAALSPAADRRHRRDTIAIRQGVAGLRQPLPGIAARGLQRRYALVYRQYAGGRAGATSRRSVDTAGGIHGRELRARAIHPLQSARASATRRARRAARRRRSMMTWRLIFIDGVSCSFSMVKGSSATMNRRILSITDRSAFTRSTALLKPLTNIRRLIRSPDPARAARRGAGGGRHRPSPARSPAEASACPRSAGARHCRPCR